MGLKQKNGTPMSISSRIVIFALVAAFGVLVVFLHPAAFGAYTTTHGPATDLCSIAAIYALFAAMGAEWMLALLCLALRLPCRSLPAGNGLYEPAVIALRC